VPDDIDERQKRDREAFEAAARELLVAALLKLEAHLIDHVFPEVPVLQVSACRIGCGTAGMGSRAVSGRDRRRTAYRARVSDSVRKIDRTQQALSALSNGEGLSRDRERALC